MQAPLRPRHHRALFRSERHGQDDGGGVLPRELDRDLYKIDLSRVVSKCIAESVTRSEYTEFDSANSRLLEMRIREEAASSAFSATISPDLSPSGGRSWTRDERHAPDGWDSAPGCRRTRRQRLMLATDTPRLVAATA